MVGNGVANKAPDSEEHIKGEQCDSQARGVTAGKQRRVNADVVASVGKCDRSNSGRGSGGADPNMNWRIVAMNPSADTDENRDEAEKPNPGPRQDATAKEADKTDGDEGAEAEILPSDDMRASKAATGLREKQRKNEDVVDVGGSKGQRRRGERRNNR